MDTKQFLDVYSNELNKNFNVDNQFANFFYDELQKAKLGLSEEQLIHIYKIFEYSSKATSKHTAISLINTLIELGILTVES